MLLGNDGRHCGRITTCPILFCSIYREIKNKKRRKTAKGFAPLIWNCYQLRWEENKLDINFYIATRIHRTQPTAHFKHYSYTAERALLIYKINKRPTAHSTRQAIKNSAKQQRTPFNIYTSIYNELLFINGIKSQKTFDGHNFDENVLQKKWIDSINDDVKWIKTSFCLRSVGYESSRTPKWKGINSVIREATTKGGKSMAIEGSERKMSRRVCWTSSSLQIRSVGQQLFTRF